MWGAALFFLFGVMFPLLLNGQTFTNYCLGIGCFAVAAALTIRLVRQQPPSYWRLEAGIMLGLAVLFATLLAAQLPQAYEFQSRFNRQMEELRQQRDAAEPR
jgi:hypothetical protein